MVSDSNTLATILRAHQGPYFDGVTTRCGCRRIVLNAQEWAEHVDGVLRSVPGIAIVELPELMPMADRENVAESIRNQPMWLAGDSWTTLGSGEMDGLVEFEADSQNVYGAVTLTGAETLAAANAAETGADQ
jgi:hypothetical protein